jgi:phosphoenolpyruvate-protein kinase (PTS system EI component)
MTAPILEEFEGILCLAGTVRSHLAIISREFGVPVLMNVRAARPFKTGERVHVRYSADPQNVDAYFGDEVKPRAVVTAVEEQS